VFTREQGVCSCHALEGSYEMQEATSGRLCRCVVGACLRMLDRSHSYLL
jgi:hypothetical protein